MRAQRTGLPPSGTIAMDVANGRRRQIVVDGFSLRLIILGAVVIPLSVALIFIAPTPAPVPGTALCIIGVFAETWGVGRIRWRQLHPP
jgi:hypothetical protein